MPTYEYICNACGHEFELFQSMRDPVKRKCPKCAKPRLERLIGTGAAVLFKGSGFYETDYRSDSYKKAAEAETKAPATKSEGATSTEKSPASDTAAKPEKPAARETPAKSAGAKPAAPPADGGRAKPPRRRSE